LTCRICGNRTETVLDLGSSPPANSLLTSPTDYARAFPLVLEHCSRCENLQLRDCLDTIDLYRNYLYVTPNSPQLQAHYERLMATLLEQRYIGSQSFVLEVGSNVGMFLRYLRPRVRKVLGIDPAANICRMALDQGIDTICDFFEPRSAEIIKRAHGMPSIIIARHCLAHNPDPHSLISAASSLLTDDALLVIENAYALNTVQQNEFDQIYHEHMFYFSVRSMSALLAFHGLHLVNAFLAPVHGGSIVFVAKRQCLADEVVPAVGALLERECALLTSDAFNQFCVNTQSIRSSLRNLVFDCVSRGKSIYTYGATAKGNTLLNYVGLTREQIPFCADSTPVKQGKYLPQSLIRVVSEREALANPPDYFLLTAWNYRDEIITKVRRSGNDSSRFIVPVPFVEVL
jgi:C-methyltransferase